MTPLNTPLTLVIADDHPLVLEGLKSLINKNSNYKVIGEATNGVELIEQVRSLKPDLVLTDIMMPVKSGVEATKTIKSELPKTAILAMTFNGNDVNVFQILRAGASGIILKDSKISEIEEALQSVYTGEAYYSQSFTFELLKSIKTNSSNTSKLSNRERSIVKLLCQEYSNKEIAATLFLSIRTVEWYRREIFKKLGVRNTAGLIMYLINTNPGL